MKKTTSAVWHIFWNICVSTEQQTFRGNSLREYLESIGVKFGANLNAYTAIDETVYNIANVPVIRDGIIDSCLLILHDWADDLTLDPKEIDKERGVIHEEWRTRTGAMMRMYDTIFPKNVLQEANMRTVFLSVQWIL